MESNSLLYLFLASGGMWILLLGYALKLRANQRRLEGELRDLRQHLDEKVSEGSEGVKWE